MNKAPDKIFIKVVPSKTGGYIYTTANSGDEYIRKDALIDKLYKWFEEDTTQKRLLQK